MFLLEHERKNRFERNVVIPEKQLAEEKATWDHYPANLYDKQIADPFIVVKQLFNEFSLAVYRDHLFEWLLMAMSETSNYEPELTAEEVIGVYEHMIKLYDAAWIVYQRQSDEPKRIKSIIQRSKAALDTVTLETAPPKETALTSDPDVMAIPEGRPDIKQPRYFLRTLYPEPTPAEILALQKVKDFILERFPTVQAIYFLGSTTAPYICYLLLLVADEEKREEGHLSTIIEDHLRFLSHAHIILHKSSSAIENSANQGRFWDDTFERAYLVYKDEALEVTDNGIHPDGLTLLSVTFFWHRWGKQGKDLLRGAKFYLKIGNYRLAAFSLHKATEMLLKGIIHSVTGYRIQMHNLSRLLRFTLLFTTALKEVFELNTREGVREFTFLRTAYKRSYYGDTFDPDQLRIRALYKKIEQLYRTTEAVYQRYHDSLEKD
ncbi:HEPN domain-containing protein [Mucilaginibacter daejeonensis]|uniref:HEPN domain-containing protein n=1 Tax=Mucilaginibacter daejeonensis TaxID=398049 RepID=UPI001D17592A|nr:HEPN domain-containing protein [Mucilaginibacter daejeonensis]UEG53367.1 HEPN domain-containing protein [Mucilaginibacter daejeonensis]